MKVCFQLSVIQTAAKTIEIKIEDVQDKKLFYLKEELKEDIF